MISFKNFVRSAALAVALTAGAVMGIAAVPLVSTTAEAAVASSIVVRGNTRVEAATIRNYVTIKPGRSYSAADIDASIKALYDTGLFADVTIRQAGGSLVVSVVENPVVNTVIFKGNKKVKSNILVQVVETKPRGVFTDAKLQSDVQRIQDYYGHNGRDLATIDPQVTKLPDNRVDVVFVIHEGKRTGVGTISFVGNHAYSSQKLKGVIVSKQHNILSWLNRKDIFDEAKLAADQEALRRFYMAHGYADFRVVNVDHTFNEATGRYHITYTLEEGPRYRFSTVNIDSSIPNVNTASLRSSLRTRPGAVFDATKVEKTIEDMTIELSRQGYNFAQVRPRGDRNYDNHTIAVTYLVDEGPRVYIERINIYGNTKTRDYVIRREFDVAEGDPYNRVMIDRAERRLRNLDYFKSVNITTEPGSAPDRVIVNVNVEDQSTGEFSIGAGYATTGFIAELSMNERNFLGRGQQLSASIGYGQDQQSYSVSFTDPYFLGYHISAGFDLYQNDYSSWSQRPFDETVTGGGLRFGFPISDDLTLETNYKLIRDEVSNSTAPVTSFPNGTTWTSSLGYAVKYSTIDNYNDPRSGVYAKWAQDFAGVGGDTKYIRSTIDARYYRELYADADIVGLVKVSAGNITGLGQDVRALDDFFKGGETIRGFATYGIGPRDSANLAVGGKNFYAATAEVQFPLPGLPPDFGLRGALFADAGSVFGTDVAGATDENTLRSSVGGSILWASPIGLLRADFAQALTKAKTDDTEFFRFSAGKQF
jgi:outer membrane protein insertion porin family